MRAFIAINFDDDIKHDILMVQETVRGYAVSGRWKHMDNFHLTLKFLGEINPDMVERISGLMDEISEDHSPFDLYLTDMGSFKGRECLRVLWLGVGGDTAALHVLHDSISEVLGDIGFERNDRFSPHITLGQDVKLNAPLEQLKREILPPRRIISVKYFYLMDSRVIDRRRIYTPVRRFELKGKV